MFASKKDIVGIDIGSSSVKVVRLRESRGTYQLENLGIMPLGSETIVDNTIMDSPAIIDTVSNLLASMKIKTKRVATSVSGHSVIIRKISLPVMTEAELEASIQWEAEQYIPFDISEVNIDFQIIGPDAKDPAQMNVMLVAAKKILSTITPLCLLMPGLSLLLWISTVLPLRICLITITVLLTGRLLL